MTSTLTPRRSRLTGLLALAAALCGVAAPAHAQSLPGEVRIGFRKGAAILVLARKQQVIEARLKSLGVSTAKWVEFQFGPPMLAAMGAGAIELGSVGDMPPIFSQAGGFAHQACASYYLAHKDFAARYLAVLSAVLDEIGKTTRWSGEHRNELATLAAEVTGIDARTWSTAFGRAEFIFGPVTPAHVAQQQQQLANAYLQFAIIPRKINVADIVWQAPRH